MQNSIVGAEILEGKQTAVAKQAGIDSGDILLVVKLAEVTSFLQFVLQQTDQRMVGIL